MAFLFYKRIFCILNKKFEMKYILSFLFVCFCLFSSYSQSPLPIGMTEQEEMSLPYYQFSSQQKGITTPPQGNLRTMAEWEEITHLLVTWVPNYSNTLTGIVEAAVQECQVVIISSNPSAAQTTLTNNGVSMDSITFINRNYNSIWIRDYAGNPVYKDWNDSLIYVDWIYNRPRPWDDSSPETVANLLNIPFYETTAAPTDVVATGGNFMADGFGTAFSSNLILDENEAGNSFGVTAKTEAELDQVYSDFMGIDTYIKMTNLPYDDIHHIDMHMKLLDEETLLVSEYPQGVADGPQIEANLQYVLSNFNSVYGTPFKVIRIPSPPSTGGNYPDNGGWYRTYANQVFVNNTVIVPFYREEYDTIAQRILEEAMPGYNIVGVNVDYDSGEQLIASGGAIHCITHSVGVQDPLIISHQPLEDTYDNINNYEVNAYISHRSGIASATIYYKIGTTGTYQTVNMNNTGGENWQGYLPAQNGEVDIFYYIQATSVSGKTRNRPMPAPDGFWDFTVFEDGPSELQSHTINALDVYPNPSKGLTVIPVQSNGNEQGEIKMYDASGRLVKTVFEGAFNEGEKSYFIDASNFNSGTYLIQISSNKRSENHQLIIY